MAMRGSLALVAVWLIGCESNGPAGSSRSAARVAIDDEIGSICVTKADGRARCWEANGSALTDLPLPVAHYVRVQRAAIGPIGLTDDGRLFGPPGAIPDGLPPIADFRATNLWGQQGLCLIARDRSLLWGNYLPKGWSGLEADMPRLFEFDPGPVADVACAFEGLRCAVRDDGTVIGGYCPVGGDGWAQVSISLSLGCGLTRGGDVVCSPGGLAVGSARPVFAGGPYVQVATTYYAACALDARGKATCLRGDGAPLAIDDGPYTAIVAGGDLVCGIRLDGTPACFRQNADAGLIIPTPAYTFTAFDPVSPPIDLDW
jgi:hypothetical protein